MQLVIEAKTEKGRDALKSMYEASRSVIGKMARLGTRYVRESEDPYIIVQSSAMLRKFSKDSPIGLNMMSSLRESVYSSVRQVGASEDDVEVTFR